MDYSFIIRRANESDTENIKKILNEAFQNYKDAIKQVSAPFGDETIQQCPGSDMDIPLEALSESIEDIKAAINAHNIYTYIAVVDNLPVGTVRITINNDGTAYLSRFGVVASSRSIGIGKALMNVVDKLMKEKSVQRLMLHTASKHSDLVRFYYGRGFYVESASSDRGYIRVMLVKDYNC